MFYYLDQTLAGRDRTGWGGEVRGEQSEGRPSEGTEQPGGKEIRGV